MLPQLPQDLVHLKGCWQRLNQDCGLQIKTGVNQGFACWSLSAGRAITHQKAVVALLMMPQTRATLHDRSDSLFCGVKSPASSLQEGVLQNQGILSSMSS